MKRLERVERAVHPEIIVVKSKELVITDPSTEVMNLMKENGYRIIEKEKEN